MKDLYLPLISICIPTYNCEKYIGFAIESVISQTYKNLELVIVDDCSTDRTLEIIKKYRDPRIRLIKNTRNLGVEHNWNKAIAEAQGEFIKLLCHDDILYPSCLRRQLEIFKDPKNSEVNLVCCGRNIIDEQGNKILERTFKSKERKFLGFDFIRRTIRSGTNLIGEPTAVLIRTDILSKTGLFNDKIPYLIDLDLWCRILLYGEIYILREPLCAFRVSTGSLSFALSNSQIRAFQIFIKKLSNDKKYYLSRLDRILGYIKGYIIVKLRRLFYYILFQQKKYPFLFYILKIINCVDSNE